MFALLGLPASQQGDNELGSRVAGALFIRFSEPCHGDSANRSNGGAEKQGEHFWGILK